MSDDWDYIEISPLEDGPTFFGELTQSDSGSKVYKIVVSENLLSSELVRLGVGDLPCLFPRSQGRGLIRQGFFNENPDDRHGLVLYLYFQSIISELPDPSRRFRGFNYTSDAFYRSMRGFWKPTSSDGSRKKKVVNYDLRPILETGKHEDYKLSIRPQYPFSTWPDIKGRLVIWDRPYLEIQFSKSVSLDGIERWMWALDSLFGIITGEYVLNSSASLKYYRLKRRKASEPPVRPPHVVTYRGWNPPKLNLLFGGSLLHITDPQDLFRIIREFLRRYDELENVISLYRLSKFIAYKELSLIYILFLLDKLFETGTFPGTKPERVLSDNEFESSKGKILSAAKRELQSPAAQKYWMDRLSGVSNGYGFRRRLDSLLDSISSLIDVPRSVRKDASKFRDSFAHGDILPKGMSAKNAFHLAIVFDFIVDCIVFKELQIPDECIRGSHNLNARRTTVRHVLKEYGAPESDQ